MPQMPIPNDWNGTDWECFIIEWPDSEQWTGILRGFVTTPLRGRFWDGKTGSIIDAQDIGRIIEERNPVTTCEEIVAALQGIQAAVENLDVSADLQVAIQTNINSSINVVATAVADSLATQSGLLVAASVANSSAQASAMAWSQSFAQNLVGVEIINNTEAQFRPIDIAVDPPPAAEEATPTGITAVLDSTAPSDICRRVYWMVRNAKELISYFQQTRFAIADTVLSIMGVVSSGLWVAALRADPASKRFLIPAAVIIAFAHRLQALFNETIDPIMLLDDWIDNNYQEIVCDVVDAVENLFSTDDIQTLIMNNAVAYGVPINVASLALLIFNYSSLAALYYVSPLLDPAPVIPASEPADICTFCLE